mmetsp:Transcript_109960/g.342837  ORF Transcript_109960/g.342837 Transcript_109960/m.342837 type:complete len:115 (-) Transcript_109960:191-535(-)
MPISIPCDLMSFKSVRAAADKMCADFSQKGMDALVNNAGIMAFKDKATEDGCDVQMQTNHLSHFLLAKLCMPLLETAASLRGEARIVGGTSRRSWRTLFSPTRCRRSSGRKAQR